MRTIDGLFAEFAAAFQFPAYFGANWPAFAECIADLSWLGPVNTLAIVVTESEEVLDREDDLTIKTFVRILTRAAAEEWAEPISVGESWDRSSVPCHVILNDIAWTPGVGIAGGGRWVGAGAVIGRLEWELR